MPDPNRSPVGDDDLRAVLANMKTLLAMWPKKWPNGAIVLAEGVTALATALERLELVRGDAHVMKANWDAACNELAQQDEQLAAARQSLEAAEALPEMDDLDEAPPEMGADTAWAWVRGWNSARVTMLAALKEKHDG